MVALNDARHWIAGEWLDNGDRRDSIDPATGQMMGRFYDAPVAVAQQAIDAALAAFSDTSWCHDSFQRATALSHLADAYAARLSDVIDTLCRENGKVRGEATFEASLIPRALRFAAGFSVREIAPIVGKSESAVKKQFTRTINELKEHYHDELQ